MGCKFELDSVQPATAIVQVAPRFEAGVCIAEERWETNVHHHSYVDQYGNRCERFELGPGGSGITYAAHVAIASPADLIVAARRGYRWRHCRMRF